MEQRARKASDRELTARVWAALAPLTIAGLQAEVRSGVVYLRGTAVFGPRRGAAEAAVRRVPGIRAIVAEPAPNGAGEVFLSTATETTELTADHTSGASTVEGEALADEYPAVEVEERPVRTTRGDDEIAEDVRMALGEDVATADLAIDVVVRRRVVHLFGVVDSLETLESAQEVAGRVPGVVGVAAELEIDGC